MASRDNESTSFVEALAPPSETLAPLPRDGVKANMVQNTNTKIRRATKEQPVSESELLSAHTIGGRQEIYSRAGRHSQNLINVRPH